MNRCSQEPAPADRSFRAARASRKPYRALPAHAVYQGHFEFREVTPNRAALDRGHSARQTEISRRVGINRRERLPAIIIRQLPIPPSRPFRHRLTSLLGQPEMSDDVLELVRLA